MDQGAAACSIGWFAERDIDTWLAEELRTNPRFCDRLLAYVNLPNAIVPAVRALVSIMDDHGRETDVEALFTTRDGKTVTLLVENKIKAGFQTNQMIDYAKRGARGQREGKWDAFRVLVFAPAYRNIGRGLPASVQVLTFEEAAGWLRSEQPCERAAYRASFLERAATANIVSVETENPFIGIWWKAVYEMLGREFGGFFVNDRKRLPKNMYVNPKCAGMPKYLRLDLKGDQGRVELNFAGCDQYSLREAMRALGTSKYLVVQYAKGASLQISDLTPYQISDGLGVIETSVRSSYRAAKDILTFWRSKQATFDEMMNALQSDRSSQGDG